MDEYIHYNVEIPNQTNSDIQAKYDVTLLRPLLSNPGEYYCAIERFRLPIAKIPLTRDNIPYNAWQVAIGFNENNTWYYDIEYVPQYNPVNIQCDYLLNLSGGIAYINTLNPSNTIIENFEMGNYGSNPQLQTSGTYVYIANIGAKAIGIYDLETFNFVTTITTTNNIVCFNVDISTDNIYVGESNSPFEVVQYVYNSVNVDWTATGIYTSTGEPLIQPKSVILFNSSVIVSDYALKKLFIWTAAGEPAQTLYILMYLSPNLLTASATQLIINCDSSVSQYDDLYGVNNEEYFNLNNSEAQATGGSVTSQLAFLGDYRFAIGNDSFLYAQQAPLSPSNTWFGLSQAIFGNVLSCTNQTIGTLMIISTSNSLYVFNVANTSQYYTHLITDYFINGSLAITSMDYFSNYKVLATGDDSKLYISNYPFGVRNFLTVNVANSANQVEFTGVNNNALVCGDAFNINQVTLAANVSGFCLVMKINQNFIVSNQVNSNYIHYYDINFNPVSAASTLINIDNIHYFNYMGNHSVLLASGLFIDENAGVVNLYTDDVTLQNISRVVLNQTITYCTAVLGFYFACVDNYDNSTPSINIYNCTDENTPTSSLIFTIGGSNYTVIDMCNFNNSLLIACEFGGTYNIYLVVFTDTTFTVISSTSIVITTQTAFTQMRVHELLQELYLINTTGVQAYSIANNYAAFGTFVLPNISTSSAYIFQSGYYPYNTAFTEVTSELTLFSACVSKLNNNILYGIDSISQLAYEGEFNSGNNSVEWTQTSYSLEYTQISCGIVTYTPPEETPANGFYILNEEYALLSNINSTLTSINSLSLVDGNICYTNSTSSNLFSSTLQGGLTSFNTGLNNLQGFQIGGVQIGPAGDYSLWSYQDYLNKINEAFTNSFDNMKARYQITPTTAPKLIFNPSTRLFALQIDSSYNDTDFKIDMNMNLYNMFLFPSSPDQGLTGFNTLAIIDNTGQGGDTINVYQETPSLSKFYDLVKINIQTYRMPVSGDNTGLNSSAKIITDVAPDTDTLAPSGLLLFSPTILRWYNLNTNCPLNSVDVYFSYTTKSDKTYIIDIAPNEYASCKILFFKKI